MNATLEVCGPPRSRPVGRPDVPGVAVIAVVVIRLVHPSPPAVVPPARGSSVTWCYADLHYDTHHAIADGDLVAVNSTTNGRHVAPFVLYTAEGEVEVAFPPTGKTFAMTQSHWFRIADGKIVEHWANRDDLGHARQLGWLPPTPSYFIRMARAKRKAKRQLSS